MRRTRQTLWTRIPRFGGVVSSAVAAVLVVSAAAYGWVSTRPATGGGNVATGEPLQSISVVGPASVQLELDEPVALGGSFVNDNSFTVSVARVTITVTGIRGTGVCDIRAGVNFVTTDAVPPAGGRFTIDGASPVAGTGSGDWSGASILFRSSPDFDQSGCLGRRLNLKYTAIAA